MPGVVEKDKPRTKVRRGIDEEERTVKQGSRAGKKSEDKGDEVK